MSAYERYLQSQKSGGGSSATSLSPYQRFQKGITLPLAKPKFTATAGGGSVDINKQQEQRPSEFLKMPWWKQIFQPEVLNRQNIVQAAKEVPGMVAKKAKDFVVEQAKGSGSYAIGTEAAAPYAMKLYKQSMKQFNEQTDFIKNRIASEKDANKKARLQKILDEHLSYQPKKSDYNEALGWTKAQILAKGGLAAEEVLGALPIGGIIKGGVEAATVAEHAAPIFSRPLGQVLKETGAKLLTKEGAIAAGKTIGKEAAVGAGYGALGAVAQGATSPQDITKQAAIGAAITPVLGGALKLGARGVSELVAGQMKTPFERFKSGESITPKDFADNYVKNNAKEYARAYDKIVQEKFGSRNIVSADEGKFAIPGFNSTKSADYHEAASQFAKERAKRLLNDNSTKDKPVLILAGGSGAGKTSGLEFTAKKFGKNFGDYALVHDSNISNVSGGISRIEDALKSGRKIVFQYTWRDPLDAFSNGVIPRVAKEGRIVPVDVFIDNNFGARATVDKLVERYGNNKNVEFRAVDNSHGKGGSKLVSIDKIPQIGYTKDELRNKIYESLQRAKSEGKITESEYQAFLGENTSSNSGRAGTVNSQGTEQPSGRGLEKAKVSDTTGSKSAVVSVKKYPTIHEGGKIKMVEGKPVRIVDGVDTFVHKGEGQFVVSEASTGRAIAAGNTEAGAIESAKFKIQDNGKTSLLRLIKERKLTPEQLKQIPTETVAPESNIGVSKVAQSVNAKSIEKNLTTGFKDLAGYEKINIKDQAQRASGVLKNMDDTLAMLRGEKQVPNGLNEAMFLKAAEDHAYATKNIDLLQEIAKSPLTSETSRSAQTLRALAERDPDSATAKIMELKKAREEAMLKKTKQRDAAKIVSEAKKEIKKKIKEAEPTRETWSSFIDSIKCK